MDLDEQERKRGLRKEDEKKELKREESQRLCMGCDGRVFHKGSIAKHNRDQHGGRAEVRRYVSKYRSRITFGNPKSAISILSERPPTPTPTPTPTPARSPDPHAHMLHRLLSPTGQAMTSPYIPRPPSPNFNGGSPYHYTPVPPRSPSFSPRYPSLSTPPPTRFSTTPQPAGPTILQRLAAPTPRVSMTRPPVSLPAVNTIPASNMHHFGFTQRPTAVRPLRPVTSVLSGIDQIKAVADNSKGLSSAESKKISDLVESIKAMMVGSTYLAPPNSQPICPPTSHTAPKPRNTPNEEVKDWTEIASRVNSCVNFREIAEKVPCLVLTPVEELAVLSCTHCAPACGQFEEVAAYADEVPEKKRKTSANTSIRRTLNPHWCAKKQSIKAHLTGNRHLVNYQQFLKEGGAKEFKSKNQEALTHLLGEVLMMVNLRLPFTSFPKRIALNIKHGLNMGFQNHSTQFPPQAVDTMYHVLSTRLGEVLNTMVPYGECASDTLPFSIAVDKDTCKKRARQVWSVRFADMQYRPEHLKEYFINSCFTSCPSVVSGCGKDLAKLLFTSLKKIGVSHNSMSRFVGLCADGQYLNLDVARHLAEQHSLGGLLELWDEAHMIELIWKHALEELPEVKSIMDTIDKIIVDLCGPLYEKYIALCVTMKRTALQPAVLKKLKFIKHSQEQYVKFIKMNPVIKAVLQSQLLTLRPAPVKKPVTLRISNKAPAPKTKKGKKSKKSKNAQKVSPAADTAEDTAEDPEAGPAAIPAGTPAEDPEAGPAASPAAAGTPAAGTPAADPASTSEEYPAISTSSSSTPPEYVPTTRTQAQARLRVVSGKDFISKIALINDVIGVQSRFSLSMQRRLQFVNEYVNIAELYRETLNRLQFEKRPTPPMMFLLKTFYAEHAKVDPFYAPGDTSTGTRSVTAAATAEANESSALRVERLLLIGEKMRLQLQTQCEEYFWKGGPNSLHTAANVKLLKNVAAFINHIGEGLFPLIDDLPGINSPQFQCGRCRGYQKDKVCTSSSCKLKPITELSVEVPPLVGDFKPATNFDLTVLSVMVPPKWQHHITANEVKRLKDVLTDCCQWLKDKNISPTLDLACRVLFVEQANNYLRCYPGILDLLLKALTASASEAAIESYGSVMEGQFKRYTRFTGDDDQRMQNEMFLLLNSPKLPTHPSWDRFIAAAQRETNKRYPGAIYAHQNGRLCTSSLTLKDLDKKSSLDKARISTLHYY